MKGSNKLAKPAAFATLGAAAFAVFFLSTAVLAGAGVKPGASGDPLPGLTAEQIKDFDNGKTEFTTPATVADGLGPVFNGSSCRGCHRTPVTGGGSTTMVTRFGTVTDGSFDPLETLGGSLIQSRAIGPPDSSHQFRPETVPDEASIVARRRTQPLFGLGLVDAVPDQTFIDLAAREANRNDGTAGRVNLVTNLSTGMPAVGKFGWKGQVAALFDFSGDGLLNEIGITNPLFPNENCPGGDCSELTFNPQPGLNDSGIKLRAIADYMTLLGPPPRGEITGHVQAGENVFNQIGCAGCHAPTLKTGTNTVAALDNKTFHPYSDFLLHDIGTGDGIVQGQATGDEIRTAPLWGLRMFTKYIHDGRATTLEDAILAHGGQAAASRESYLRLGDSNQAKLLEFLNSL